jgi:hypothetical protein
MKKLFAILSFLFFSNIVLFGQDNPGNDNKIREKMTEYIQRRLSLSKGEAERFSPVFLRYFNEWRNTLRDFKEGGDKLMLQQRIVELRLRYRNEFKDIIGEKRSNEVYEKQQEFIDGIRKMREEQRIENRTNRRFRGKLE